MRDLLRENIIILTCAIAFIASEAQRPRQSPLAYLANACVAVFVGVTSTLILSHYLDPQFCAAISAILVFVSRDICCLIQNIAAEMSKNPEFLLVKALNSFEKFKNKDKKP